MSIRRQWEIFLSSIMLGFMVYVIAQVPHPVPAWLYGVVVASLVWGMGYNIGQAKARSEQILKELQSLREEIAELRPLKSN